METELHRHNLGNSDGITLVFYAYPEHTDPTDNDEFYDTKEKKQKLYDQLNRYELVYFIACIKAYKLGVELSSEYLGNCLYESYEEFIDDTNDYIGDMKETVISEAKTRIKHLKAFL